MFAIFILNNDAARRAMSYNLPTLHTFKLRLPSPFYVSKNRPPGYLTHHFVRAICVKMWTRQPTIRRSQGEITNLCRGFILNKFIALTLPQSALNRWSVIPGR